MKLFSLLSYFIIIIITYSTNVIADNNNNDSIDEPEIIFEGNYSGSVTNDFNNEDNDYYKLIIPGQMKVILIFKLIEGSSLSGDFFDENKVEISEYLYINNQGEKEEIERWNQEDSETSIYIGLSGDCSYSIEMKLEPLDNNDSFDDAEKLNEGENIGKVSYDYDNYEDNDYYYFKIPSSDLFTLTINLITGSSLTVDFYDNNKDRISGLSLYITDIDVPEQISYKNTKTIETNFYLLIKGNGGYSINLNQTEGDRDDSLDVAKLITTGTYYGSVTESYYSTNDEDYYVVSVPAKKKLIITVKLIEPKGDYSSLTVQGYDNYKVEHNIYLGIWIYLSSPGETDSSSWKNTLSEPQNVYLGFSGDADYKFTIEFTGLFNSTTNNTDPNAIPHGDVGEGSGCGGIMGLSMLGILLSTVSILNYFKKK